MTAAKTTQPEPVAASPWEALRAAFPAEAVNKKPQPLKKNAEKGKCDECGKFHGLPAIHIDYVGHAYVTERLNSVDPGWELEPLALDARGEPLMTEHDGSLTVWAKLTVLGKSKIEVGEGDNPKEAWSDVLKRCAMRFGIAVDQWKKSEDAPPAVEPEDTYGVCPGCGKGEVVKRTKKDGAAYAKCSLGKYRDPSTCQWVDWEPDFEARLRTAHPDATQAQRGTSTGAAPSSVPSRAASSSRPASNGSDKPRPIREPILRDEQPVGCPTCGTGTLELVTWPDGNRQISCSDWSSCRYRAPVADDRTAMPVVERAAPVAAGGDVDPDSIPFAFPPSADERSRLSGAAWAARQ